MPVSMTDVRRWRTALPGVFDQASFDALEIDVLEFLTDLQATDHGPTYSATSDPGDIPDNMPSYASTALAILGLAYAKLLAKQWGLSVAWGQRKEHVESEILANTAAGQGPHTIFPLRHLLDPANDAAFVSSVGKLRISPGQAFGIQSAAAKQIASGAQIPAPKLTRLNDVLAGRWPGFVSVGKPQSIFSGTGPALE